MVRGHGSRGTFVNHTLSLIFITIRAASPDDDDSPRREPAHMEKTILVTGGAGFIGSNFILQWIEQEATPVVNLDKLTYAGNPQQLAPGRPPIHDIALPREMFAIANSCAN